LSGTDKLLARIKSLFAPNRPAAPSKEVEVTAPSAPTMPEIAETAVPDATAAVDAPATAQEAPALVAEAPAIVADTPSPVAESPTRVAETPTILEVAPTQIEEGPVELEPAPADGLTLRLETERGSRTAFHVTKSGATIGRGPESTIQLADLSVSRKHARIAYKQGVYWLSDLGSMGGTWVDGTKLAAPRRVATGQTIDIGLCRLVVEAAAESEKAGVAKGPSNAA
jgi:hypothetical protein